MKAAFLLPCLLWGALGCADRTHMSPGYGRSYSEFIARQMVNPGAGEREAATKGLDTQEASAISQGYNQSLARKGSTVTQEPTLLQVTTGNKLPPFPPSP